MNRIPVKLSKGEMVLGPSHSKQYRQRLEEMNKEGLLARNAGGVAAYRANGGAVYREEGGAVEPLPGAIKPTFQEWAGDNRGAIDNLGASLVSIGQRDFKGASEALSRRPEVDKTAGKELKSKEERAQAIRESTDAAAKATQYIDAGAGDILDYISKNWSQVLSSGSWTDLISKTTTATIGWVTGQERKAVETVAHEQFAGTSNWNAYRLFTQEMKLLQLKSRSLVKGGSISDSESKAAAETIATDYTDAATTKTQLATVIERNNVSLRNLELPDYVSKAVASAVTGKGYEAKDGTDGVSLIANSKGEAVEVSPDNIEEGMKFTSEGYTGDYNYTVFAKDGDAYVKTEDDTEYKLSFDKAKKQFYVDGNLGATYLTPVT